MSQGPALEISQSQDVVGKTHKRGAGNSSPVPGDSIHLWEQCAVTASRFGQHPGFVPSLLTAEGAQGLCWRHARGFPAPCRVHLSQKFCVSVKDTGGQTLPLVYVGLEVLSSRQRRVWFEGLFGLQRERGLRKGIFPPSTRDFELSLVPVVLFPGKQSLVGTRDRRGV